MTKRELFRGFYRVARLRESDGDLGKNQPGADALNIQLVAAAARAGLSDDEIKFLAFEASWARVCRHRRPFEPSRSSVQIQMLVHTFGRVRRSF